MTPQLVLLCPSRGRPAKAAGLARAVARTARPGFTRLVFVLDYDDPELDAYLAGLRTGDPGLLVMVTRPGGPRKMGPVLNWAAAQYASARGYLGFMGDDHLPHTGWWDSRLCAAIGEAPGVAYGNDLFQGAALPTAVVLSSVIVRVLGYMSPPPLEHLWIDDFWYTLGEATHLEYLPDVIIEHQHPAAGKAAADENYLRTGMSPALMQADGQRWERWKRETWPEDLKRLREALA